MIKELEKIRKRSADILGNTPQKRAELVKQLAKSNEDLKAARDAQEKAEDMDSYDEAVEAARRAELSIKFADKALKNLDGAPRMSEAEYMAILGTCSRIVDKAASDYLEVAEAAMAQLKAAHDAYIAIGTDVTQTLTELDNAANVLQVKYRCRKQEYAGMDPVYIADSYEWTRHALRFYPVDLAKRVTRNNAGVAGKPWDSVLCGAWTAVERSYPRKIY